MSDWKDIAKNVTPILAGFLPPPFNGLAATAAKIALGLPKGASDKQLNEAVANATPEQIQALKHAENDFKTRMEEIGVDLEELAVEDRKDARAFAEKVGLDSLNILAVFNGILVCIIIAGIIFLFYNDKLTGMEAMEVSVLTLMAREGFAMLAQVNNFFFGSSHGSKHKSEMINQK